MSNEENMLFKRFGKQTPFRVPEGYFEAFEQSLMENLPNVEAKLVERAAQSDEREEPIEGAGAKVVTMGRSRMQRRYWWSYAVAVVVALVVMGAAYWSMDDSRKDGMTATTVQQPPSGYTVDQVADYAMVDNTEMYALMVGE